MALVESECKASLKGRKNGEEITIVEISFAFDESVPEEVQIALTEIVGEALANAL